MSLFQHFLLILNGIALMLVPTLVLKTVSERSTRPYPSTCAVVESLPHLGAAEQKGINLEYQRAGLRSGANGDDPVLPGRAVATDPGPGAAP